MLAVLQASEILVNAKQSAASDSRLWWRQALAAVERCNFITETKAYRTHPGLQWLLR